MLDEKLLARVHEHAIAYLRDLPERPVAPQLTRGELLERLRVPLSEAGEDPLLVIDALAEAGERGTMASAAPRFFGFVIGGSLPVTLAADWLTSTWDQNAGLHAASPVAMVAEEVAIEWLLDLFDLPRESSVGFVTGCQMAQFTCLAAARHEVLRRSGWDVEQKGLNGSPRIHVVASAEAHVTVHTAVRMLGLGMESIHPVETDAQGRMKIEVLENVIRRLDGPIIVSCQVGNVNTGAIDPVGEIVSIAHARNAWVHVDGAFGLWGRACNGKRALLTGVETADSWATDAHKWLNVPYDNGIAIVRNAGAHRAAMTVSASYLEQTAGRERDAVDWTPEFSRRARGNTVYAALRALGRGGIDALIERGSTQAVRMAELLRRDARVEILNDVVLNQVLVRFGGSDDLTREVVARVQRDGTCWLSGTTWHGLAAMRISFSNWATSQDDVERSAAAILRCIA